MKKELGGENMTQREMRITAEGAFTTEEYDETGKPTIPYIHEDLRSLNELADQFGYSHQHFARLAKSGLILGWHRGRYIFTTAAAVQFYLDNFSNRKHDPAKEYHLNRQIQVAQERI